MQFTKIKKYTKVITTTLVGVSLLGAFTVFTPTASALSSLTEIGAINDPVLLGAFGVDVSEANDLAVVASWHGKSLSVIDVSDEKNPEIIGSVTDNMFNMASDVVLDATGKFAYVTITCPASTACTVKPSLIVVDITNPTTPMIVWHTDNANGNSLLRVNGVTRDGSMIYLATQNSIERFDISNPAVPVYDKTWKFDPAGVVGGDVEATEIALDGSVAVITTFGTDRIHTIDLNTNTTGIIFSPISGCSNPMPGRDGCIWSPHVGPGSSELRNPIGVAVDGRGYAYVTAFGASTAGEGRFTVVDISDPENPVLVTSLDSTASSAFDHPYGISIKGNRALVTSMYTGDNALVDISNPALPVVISTEQGGQSGSDIAFYGDMALVTDMLSKDFRVLDMVDPDAPTSVSGSTSSGGSAIRALIARSSTRPRSGMRQRVDGGLLCPVDLNLSLGSANEDVTRVKAIVASTGDFAGDITNMVYDQETADAVLKFQKSRNLKLQDGIVGIETQAAMAPICRGEEGGTAVTVDLSA